MMLEQLGEGNYGQVYKAYHKQSGNIVAIKVVPISSDIESLKRWKSHRFFKQCLRDSNTYMIIKKFTGM